MKKFQWKFTVIFQDADILFILLLLYIYKISIATVDNFTVYKLYDCRLMLFCCLLGFSFEAAKRNSSTFNCSTSHSKR